MRKLIVTLTASAAIFMSGMTVWQAEAQTLRGAANVAANVRNYTPIEKAACQGWGRWCGPGFVRACGPYRCWCRPCQ
jgi:hypothetical protein